jgi:hypothetical protein
MNKFPVRAREKLCNADEFPGKHPRQGIGPWTAGALLTL